jgi:hypothetical protein
MPEKGELMPELSARQNIVVIADEAKFLGSGSMRADAIVVPSHRRQPAEPPPSPGRQ